MLFFPSKKLLGLDVGTSSVKAAVLEGGRKGYVLKGFAMQATPEEAIVSGEVIESGALASVVRELSSSLKAKKKKVATSIWGSGVIVKKISVPQMEKDLIREQVHWEAEQYIPFDINEINIDYHLIGDSPGGGGTLDILLVAAKKIFVGKFAEMIEESGLSLNVVDVGGFALANCFEANYGPMRGQTIALLNIGAGIINFVVLDDGNVVFCRDLSVGGRTYNQEIQKQLGVSAAEAETLKLGASAGQDVPSELQSILQNTNQNIVEEIAAGLEFFSATSSGSNINRVFLSGGSVFVPDLVDQLSKALKAPCEPMDPFASIQWDRKKFSTEYINQIKPFAAIAVGLAMREEEKT